MENPVRRFASIGNFKTSLSWRLGKTNVGHRQIMVWKNNDNEHNNYICFMNVACKSHTTKYFMDSHHLRSQQALKTKKKCINSFSRLTSVFRVPTVYQALFLTINKSEQKLLPSSARLMWEQETQSDSSDRITRRECCGMPEGGVWRQGGEGSGRSGELSEG